MEPSRYAPLAWSLIVAGFLSGALLGLRFHEEGFAGGYASLQRRLLRLGHIACIALGLIALELLRTAAQLPSAPRWIAPAFLAGALLMPATCFLSAWRIRMRHAFVLPVALLVAPAVALIAALRAGSSP
jgi:hypothetical protein